ncbi:uncharacterized protein TNCV_1365291 [Trichonephila clavipes]|nr:uncharacterized protein TNCV_1365291 [Trichonephila clavipes]
MACFVELWVWVLVPLKTSCAERPMHVESVEAPNPCVSMVLKCLATNLASNCVLTIIEDVSGDAQGSVPILISLLHTKQALNWELWSGVPFLLTTEPLWSLLEAHLQPNEDKARPHATRVAMSCLTACQRLPWPARSPDLSSIEHVWDMMGR